MCNLICGDEMLYIPGKNPQGTRIEKCGDEMPPII
jgi:hypothetical protein